MELTSLYCGSLYKKYSDKILQRFITDPLKTDKTEASGKESYHLSGQWYWNEEIIQHDKDYHDNNPFPLICQFLNIRLLTLVSMGYCILQFLNLRLHQFWALQPICEMLRAGISLIMSQGFRLILFWDGFAFSQWWERGLLISLPLKFRLW